MKKNLRLICLPYAGGNKYSYRSYSEKAPSFLELITLEYPGRGARMKDALMSNIADLVDDLYAQVITKINDVDYAIYGHSMGGLLTYLLTIKLLENNKKLPLHLFITGTSGPSAPGRLEKKRSLLGKKEFIQEIIDFGGMPDEMLQNEELLYFFEPILRADFKASENYIYKPHAPLNIPITVITGSAEDMTQADIQTWQHETTQPVDFKVLPGNHFFILNHADKIMYTIARQLAAVKRD
jgi:surfactin synthase thioesterase subunit